MFWRARDAASVTGANTAPGRLPEQVGVNVDRSRRVDIDVEEARFRSLRDKLDVVRTGLDRQALERASKSSTMPA